MQEKTIGVLKAAEANQVSMLFENLLTMEELLLMLKHQYCRGTVYRWIAQGMPHMRIRSKLWFSKDEVILWLQRS